MLTSRSALSVGYALIALVALIATWSENLAYFRAVTDFFPALGAFLHDTTVTPASRSITIDIGLFFLSAAIFMVIEARKYGIRFVWLYIFVGLFVAISVAFPLFLIARERKLTEPGNRSLGAIDVMALTALALVIVSLSVWIMRLF